ncbi:Membrane lipoprotein TpN32 [Streptomyces griseorubiginosus]|uniref:Lipoprotein n=1 Tax=Streptomyces griseorubiginosus TaxID=67304 RepID=A0AAI8L766_9ACTN|nr:Membrane lipoprotein TpN32 [Streptomyces griseorubiginosus]
MHPITGSLYPKGKALFVRNTVKFTTAALAAGALTLGLSACGSSDSGSASDTSGPLVVAASPTPHAEILNYVKENLAKKAGLDLEVKEFTDYVTPNTATEDGSVDANYFQNQPYLDDFNKKRGTHIAPVVTVHLEPLGLYSHKVKSADALKSGATIAVPNDSVNEARALKLLAANNLITLKDGVGNEATPADITKNPKNLKFKELEAAQTPRSLDDVDAAVVNGNYAIEADLKPATDALVLESAKDNPYGNFLAVKEGNEDDPRVKKLAKLLTSPEVKKFIQDKYAGSVIASF